MFMRKTLMLLGALAAVSPGLRAACVAQSTAERPHLVELYTAEGCSSCPPAEHWMSSLRDSHGYIGLEFHVDYWDALGWHDPFGDARYTARQNALANRGKRSVVYTPQIAVDGRVWKDWPKANPPSPPSAESPPLSLEVTLGETIRAKVASGPGAAQPANYRFYVALSENGLTSKVQAGENRGKRLDHDLVVRDLAGPLALPQAEATLKPPHDFVREKSAVVAFVEDTQTGDIVQALRLPLEQCKP
jgi:hypothetical protein